MRAFRHAAESWSMRRSFSAALCSVALLTAGLLAGCGPTDGTTPPGPANTYTVSGDAVLPGLPASAAALSLPTSAGASNWNAPHVPGEVLILDGGALTTTLSGLGLRNVQVETVSSGLQRAVTPAGEDDATFAARLAQAGLRVQPNYIYSVLSVPNDPGYPGSANAGIPIGNNAYDQDYLTRINAQAGWDELQAAGLQPVGAVTAVLDTGIDAGHPDLQGRLLAGYDFGDNDNNPAEITSGDIGHGTESAGIIGASTNNRVGLAGLTWSGRTVLPVKVFSNTGTATTTALKQGIDYAVAQGARVINMSLGITLAQMGGKPDVAVTASLQAAADKNVVLVAAAGNTPGDGLYFPASDPNVLAVGALAQSDDLACYSARPKSGQKALDLVAPGGNAGTGTGTCLSASDYDILGLNARSVPNSTRSQNGYGLRAGTSESAPQVAGAASLLRAFRSDLSAAQIKGTLTSTARTVAGGKLLDVGAAVRLSAALPGSARAYSLSVQALQGSTLVKTFSQSGTLAAGASSAPYNVAGLSQGSYTLVANLTVLGQTYTGSTAVTVSGDVGGQDIATK